ncbi:MAG: hypothetical protein PVF58_09385 [Candidatus Methanofastidiosia archaeon]
MDIDTAVHTIKTALASAIETWPGYTPKSIPMAVFDTKKVVYINHPSPPEKRPELFAATAMKINGVVTATIPLQFCEDEKDIITFMYHEGFHVYQDKNFTFEIDEDFNFFEMLAFYPELDSLHRACCAAEADIYNSSMDSKDKAMYMATLALKRRETYSRQGVLIAERNAERKEGTAYYVENIVRNQIFQKGNSPLNVLYGYFKHYTYGAAACQLLDDLIQGWHTRVAQKDSPTDILIELYQDKNPDLKFLDMPGKIQKEQKKTEKIRSCITNTIEKGVIRIQLPEVKFRGFNPRKIVSLGDGRLFHTDFVILRTSAGNIELHGNIIEDYTTKEVIFPEISVTITGETLEVNTKRAHISLHGVQCIEKNVYKVG